MTAEIRNFQTSWVKMAELAPPSAGVLNEYSFERVGSQWRGA